MAVTNRYFTPSSHSDSLSVFRWSDAFARDAPGHFEGNAVYVNEINSRGQLKLPWQRRIMGPPSADIKIGGRPRSTPSMAAKHQRELGPT
jgi:hypothetical protein